VKRLQPFERQLVVEAKGGSPSRTEADPDPDRSGVHMRFGAGRREQVQRGDRQERHQQGEGERLGPAAKNERANGG